MTGLQNQHNSQLYDRGMEVEIGLEPIMPSSKHGVLPITLFHHWWSY